MTKNESTVSDYEKSRIRERYKGTDPEMLEVIPAILETDFFEDSRPKRVAVYVRVSTDDPRQTSSFELQRNHYKDLIKQHQNWTLVGIYADEGISGTSLRHRDSFLQMIRDCEDGKIDLILCKSISRFARNVRDCSGAIKDLAALRNPVAVFFEAERLYTLNTKNDLIINIHASLAQAESESKSNSMNLSYEMRFRRGIFLTPALLGYDFDAEKGKLVINEEEALTVRLIFFMYLYGYSCQQIADTLKQLGRLTKKGNRSWSVGTVLRVLQNERHCGDVLARKTWTPSYLDHKSRKNVRNRNQYRGLDDHDAIISRDDFIATQQLITNAKYGHRGVLPTLNVINEGSLFGFVIANLRWAGFSMADYLAASNSVLPDIGDANHSIRESAPSDGDFDLRGYELVRAEFFGSFHREYITFSREDLHFSTWCIQKFPRTAHIELLFNPRDKMIAVRPTTKDNRNAIQWAKIEGDRYLPRPVNGAVFLDILYSTMNWDRACKYRVRGIHKQNETGTVILFDLCEMEAIVPLSGSEARPGAPSPVGLLPDGVTPLNAHSKKSVIAFPAPWTESFGGTVYQAKQLIDTEASGDTQHSGIPFSKDGKPLQTTSSEDLSKHIITLMNTIKQGE